jgi:DNA-binding phage protein
VKIKLYKSYSFRDKDPVIDHLRTAVQKSGNKYSKISEDSGVSSGTLSNWFEGTTKRPQFATVAAVARSLGPDGVRAVAKALTKK